MKQNSANAFTNPATNLSATVGFSTLIITSALAIPFRKSTTINTTANTFLAICLATFDTNLAPAPAIPFVNLLVNFSAKSINPF